MDKRTLTTNSTGSDAKAFGGGCLSTTTAAPGFDLLNAEDVCVLLRHETKWPAAYCSRLARRGAIAPVPGLRATYTRSSVMKYIEKLCDAANVSRRSHGRVKQ